jgi:hypothetical protein
VHFISVVMSGGAREIEGALGPAARPAAKRLAGDGAPRR